MGTPVGITAFAVDPDATNNAITYTLDDSAGGRFAIHPTTDVVTVAGPLAAGTPSYAIVVRATSQDGSIATRSFTVAVVPANPGDFDGDGDLDANDIDAMSTESARGASVPLTHPFDEGGIQTIRSPQVSRRSLQGRERGTSSLIDRLAIDRIALHAREEPGNIDAAFEDWA